MLAILGTLLTSVMSGGATGLLGIIFQRYFDSKSKGQDIEVIRLNHANALDLKRVDIEMLDRQVAGNIAIAEVQRDALVQQALAVERTHEADGDVQALAASINADRATYLTPDVLKSGGKWTAFFMGMVDWLRGITRPLLTVYLVVLTHLMFNWCRELAAVHGSVLSSVELKEIITLVLSTLLYLATVAVVWWFGTRPPRQAVTHK